MGANLEATTVEQHIRSLAKLLFYVNPVCCSLSSIFEAEKIADYLEEMKACGVGPYGQRAKVDACVQALKYMQNCQEHYSADTIGRTMAMFDRFKSRLRKEERHQENLRRDEEGRMEVDGSMIDKRLSNLALSLWAERVLLLCKIDPALLSEEDVSFTYRYLLAWLTLDNSQRPGPAINMTVREFEDRTQRENKCVIFVEKHKTAMAGSAKVVADNERVTTLMGCWYNSIRPRLSGEADTFLIKGNGQPISSNMNKNKCPSIEQECFLFLGRDTSVLKMHRVS